MRVYIRDEDGWRRVPGPADLAGVRGDLRVRGKTDDLSASVWAGAIGMAVAFGASVTREESG